MKWRYLFIICFFGILYSVLIFNIYNIQFDKGVSYAAKKSAAPERGNIYFSDKNNSLIPAVLNKEYDIVFVVPKEIQEYAVSQKTAVKEYAEELAAALDKPAADLEKQLNKKNDLYELLAQKVDSGQLEQIRNLEIRGIYIGAQNLRFYPFENLASHLMGFVSPATEKESEEYGNVQVGRYGVERKFNSLLAGKNGDSKNVVLTIDINIQSRAEEILKNLVEKWEAVGGTIIIEEPFSGKILAMANLPDFNPNNYSQFNIKNFLNPSVESVYEPGSVFKVITMAIGIDSGKISPETTYIDSGSIVLNGRKIENWDKKAHGKTTMTGVIENSINTGTVFAERKIGHSVFYDYLSKFGFNELTGIDLPGEVKGNFSNLKKNRDIDFATASFGQGVAVTPIELISAISTIANGGVLMKPLILADEKSQIIRRVISSEAAEAVAQMMVSAVKKNIIADIPNYKIAGKTGTAFVPDFKNGGYTEETIHSYAGFAPVLNPRFAILIKLEKPKAPLAGQTVVPAFKELAQFILNYYNISPDDLSVSN